MGPCAFEADRAAIGGGSAQIIGAGNRDGACAVARKLAAEGIGCIELCGAFGKTGARKGIEAVQNRIPVGRIARFSEQDEVYRRAFSCDSVSHRRKGLSWHFTSRLTPSWRC